MRPLTSNGHYSQVQRSPLGLGWDHRERSFDEEGGEALHSSICASRPRMNRSPVLVRMVTGLGPEVDARMGTKPVCGQVKR
jgi:hypothetical protein